MWGFSVFFNRLMIVLVKNIIIVFFVLFRVREVINKSLDFVEWYDMFKIVKYNMNLVFDDGYYFLSLFYVVW